MNKNLKKTLIFTIAFCIVVILVVVYIQVYGQNKVVARCSYLDPITIDLLAFFAAVFLIIEGLFKILKNPNDFIKYQLTRIMRIALGCAILTLHIIQFIHK